MKKNLMIVVQMVNPIVTPMVVNPMKVNQMVNPMVNQMKVNPIVTPMEANLMKVNLMVHAEIGVRLDRIEETGFKVKPHNYRIYLGAFAEYGVLNTHYGNSTTPMVAFDYSRGVNATLTPFMLSSESAGAQLHPLTAGIKLTMMFKLPERGKSYNYDSKDQKPGGFRKRGGNQSLQ